MFHKVFEFITVTSFFATLFSNLLLIFITTFYVKQIVGSYKRMIILFAGLGIIFSIVERIAKPFIHNYNKGLMYFSLGESWLEIPKDVVTTTLVVYVTIYAVVVTFLAVQFAFRYVSLFNPDLTKWFENYGVVAWSLYPVFIGSVNGVAIWYLSRPDEFSDDFMRNEIFEVYELDISTLPRLLIVPYDQNGEVRINNVLYLCIGTFLLSSQYLIIVYCGLQMHFQMQKELQKFSVANRKLQQQFFKALVVQVSVPTITFVLPAMPLLLGPLFDLKMSFKSGVICALLGIYPFIDSILFMLIVTEYRKHLATLCNCFAKKNHVQNSQCLTI